MPVTGMSTEEPEATQARLLFDLDGRMSPVAFLHHLRMSQGASAAARYRTAELMDEACPWSEEQYTEMSGSGEEDDCGAGAHTDGETRNEFTLLSFPGPSSCSYLSVGQSFVGTQRLSNAPMAAPEDWEVVVRLQGIDMSKGYVCGVMEAVNVPLASEPIVTFWEGEIIDNRNHSFLTHKWGASREIDMKHWRKFLGFARVERSVAAHAGRCPDLSSSAFIFMRWKETMFVKNSSAACGLTIAGFYYVCLERQSGAIKGYYFDPNSAPFQFLSLEPRACDGGGMAFGSYALA